MENKTKGEFNGLCNLTRCKSGKPATWYNHSTRLYYCTGCAKELNEDVFNKKDALRIYGHALCTELKLEETK